MATALPAFVAGTPADVRGTLVAVHFRDERGFAVFSLEQADHTRVRALGYLPPEVTLQAVVRVGGIWTQHAQYGWQLRVTTAELVDRMDRRGIVAFLVAYTTHLGPVRAAQAVEQFGDRIFAVLANSPEELCVIKGVTSSRARVIGASFADVASIADIDSWLRQIGLGKADARQVREAYGDDAARLIRTNPYRLCDDIRGIGFVTADSLRLMLGIAPTAPFRLHAGLKYVLSTSARTDGHAFLPLGELVDRTARQLDERGAPRGQSEPDPVLVAALRSYLPRFVTSPDARADLGPSGDLAGDDARVYGRDLFDAELLAATRLAQLLARDAPLLPGNALEPAIREAERGHGIVLEREQRQAVATALTRTVSIISGGPGTGKTTCTRVLVDLLEQQGVCCLLLSPTGKAAKRLAEATGREAHTIHRQLFALDRLRAQAEAEGSGPVQLFLAADAVIVDEASMVDLPLLAWLLRSLHAETRLILVGDRDQLPSVGPGAVLRDLIASGGIPVTILDVVKRQGQGSPIVDAAHAINQGHVPRAGSTAAGDLYIVRAASPANDGGVNGQQLVVESAVRLAAQVLTPQHSSPTGVAALNRALQARLNPPQPGKPEVPVTGY